MGRPKGSLNKDKPFRDALRMEIAAAQQADDKRSLRRIARKLLDVAASGDIPAIKEIADRVDGKVAQAIIGDDEADAIQLEMNSNESFAAIVSVLESIRHNKAGGSGGEGGVA